MEVVVDIERFNRYLVTFSTLFIAKLPLNPPQLMACVTEVWSHRSDKLIVDSAFVGHELRLHVSDH